MPWRASPDFAQLPTAREWRNAESGYCRSVHDDAQLISCLSGPIDRATVYIVGDSHARHLVPGAVDAFPASSVATLYLDGCPPGVSEAFAPRYASRYVHFRAPCVRRNAQAAALLESTPPSLVIVAGRWAGYGRWFDEDSAETLETALAIGAAGLAQRLAKAGHRVLVLGAVPEPGLSVSRCRAPEILVGNDWNNVRCRPRPDRLAEIRLTNARVGAIMKGRGISFLDPFEAFCNSAGECASWSGEGALFRDEDHLTVPGSRRLMSYVKSQLSLSSTEGSQMQPTGDRKTP